MGYMPYAPTTVWGTDAVVIATTTRATRKVRWCYVCNAKIRKGSRYVRSLVRTEAGKHITVETCGDPRYHCHEDEGGW